MKKWACLLLCFLYTGIIFSQKKMPDLELKAFQKNTISGVAPSSTIEIGALEKTNKNPKTSSTYFIYLLALKETPLKIEKIWIRQKSYLANIQKQSSLPIVFQDGKRKDTVIKSTDATVWKISIVGIDSSVKHTNKEIVSSIKRNELVIQLKDKWGKNFTKSLERIQILEAERMQ